MALYTIADLHLSTRDGTDKSMEVFGGRWSGYTEKLVKNWRHLVTDSDIVVIPGDISWALTLEQAREDLLFIDALPGKKIIGKGNHDFWWATMKKMNAYIDSLGIKSISFLFNNAYLVEDMIVAGTRGWYYDDDAGGVPDNTDFAKIIAREAQRLRMSLTEAKGLKESQPDAEIIAFTHFPPVWCERAVDEFLDVLSQFEIRRLYFGHIHGVYSTPPQFEYRGIKMNIASADYLSFTPKHIPKED